tara:strand:+ start:106 stop:507 length:402 start_codon:yes stop_codon:yes gene_type:complete
MKKVLYVFLFILLIGGLANLFDVDNSTASPSKAQRTSKEEVNRHPNQTVLDAIQKSLDSNGEDRWANWKVGYNESEKNIYIQVAADPLANEIAMKGYIELIKDIHKRHAVEYNMVGRVFQLGESKESCYVYGQ